MTVRGARRRIENAANLRGIDLKDIEVHEDVDDGVGFRVVANDPEAEPGDNPAFDVTKPDGPLSDQMFSDRIEQYMDALRETIQGDGAPDRTSDAQGVELERLAEQESGRSNPDSPVETTSISETVDGESIEVHDGQDTERLTEDRRSESVDVDVDPDAEDVVETSGSIYVKVELDEFDDLEEVIEKAHAYEQLEDRVSAIEDALDELSETIRVPGFGDE